MKYLPLVFLPLVAYSAGYYGVGVAIWWCFAAVSFVPVQGLVALLAREDEGLSSRQWTALLVLWGAVASWPVWEATVVFAVSVLLVQIFHRRRAQWYVNAFCMGAVAMLPLVADLDPWRAATQDASVDGVTRVLFGLTCASVLGSIVSFGWRARHD